MIESIQPSSNHQNIFNNQPNSNRANVLPKRYPSEQPRYPDSSSRSVFLNNRSNDPNLRRRRNPTDPHPRSSSKLNSNSNNNSNSSSNNNNNSHQVRLSIPRRNGIDRSKQQRSNNNLSSARSVTSTNRGANRYHQSSSSTTSRLHRLNRNRISSSSSPSSSQSAIDNLAQDSILKSGGIAAPGIKGAPLKTASAIWKLCSEMYPDVQSISLADNNLRSLQPMSMGSLVATLPNLINLSLAGNKLELYTDLNSLSPTIGGQGVNNSQKQGLNQLRELILIGNPIRIKAEEQGTAGLQQYLFELCRRFPSLQVLDGEAIDPALVASLAIPSTINSQIDITSPSCSSQTPSKLLDSIGCCQAPLPINIQPAFLGDQSTSSFVAAFCLKFFEAFDSDRDSLIDVYATKSLFSLCASTSIPVRAKALGLTRNQSGFPAQQNPSWNEYLSISRNNARLKGNRLSERIVEGPAGIVQWFKKIPKTKHPLTESSEKFVVDGWQMPGLVSEPASNSGGDVVYVNVHGEFKEVNSLTVRSFDRCFVLGAAGPASAATLKGWPCVIISDQLTVRSYSSPVSWTPTAGVTLSRPDAGLTNSAILVKNETGESTIEGQRLVKELMKLTKLNERYSVECLKQNGWNFELAVKNFEEVRSTGSLPIEAFDQK
ncbi:hypothetical protein PPACK8108_LOCUS24992 [Phakopsora pachyrhizi]|uniref:NTF2-like protein n=1 Tax=Phakopsora pachyrhizi TaxID=170000 RepID=A0AAV0BUR5_PHAPC|nr:hypothetical protein PPACK8108_LOCUS24992 [Phakopsora pachyrhizi]